MLPNETNKTKEQNHKAANLLHTGETSRQKRMESAEEKESRPVSLGDAFDAAMQKKAERA